MKIHRLIIDRNPSNSLNKCFREISETVPQTSLLQRLALSSWWVGRQPKLSIVKSYTKNILEIER
jgi:hypothetical protein